MLAEMARTMLERLGYTVTVKNSSLEALTAFQNEPERFDLVITDQTMPGMTGVDLARRHAADPAGPAGHPLHRLQRADQ